MVYSCNYVVFEQQYDVPLLTIFTIPLLKGLELPKLQLIKGIVRFIYICLSCIV